MSSAKPTKKNNPCPVCGDVSGNCRTTDSELVLCMNTLDELSTPTGWKFLGLTNGGGQWGKIVPAGQPESGNAKALRQQRAAERAAVELSRIARLKPRQQRHDEYLHKVANCPILEADRADLTRRGLSDDDLAILTPINDGRGGYVIPIRDRDGLMVGGQRRLGNVAKGGRYRWATTGENQLPETGELPLAHWSSSDGVEVVALVEGTGVKPYLTAKRLKALAIGAAGGNFGASPKSLRATLDRYSDSPVVLVPDAGAVANKSVMRQYANVQALLKKWGRELKVLWWGQDSKEHGDIDEIAADLFTEIISWGEFWAIAVGAGTVDPNKEIVTINDGDDPRCEQRHFESSLGEGLVLVTREADSNGGFKPVRQQVGNHLEAVAYINTPEGNGSALHLEFKTIRNQVIHWTMPRAFIVADTAQMLGELAGRGYFFRLSKRKDLIEYLNGLGSEIQKTYTITESTGWIKGSFVSHNKTYGEESLKFGDIKPSPDSPSEIVGSLDGWIGSVANFCAGNSRLIFALGTAFAAPLLPIVNLESGGFHLIGGTSAGKTTTLKVAASVVGFKEIPHWRTTTNGLEAIACAHNHTLLPLDEIGQADPKDVGAIAYMLANGQGKTRMTKALTNRKPKKWQLLFLSSGEIGMGQYIAQAGISLKGGQEVRMPDIPAVPTGSTTGVFEDIHGCESSKQLAQSLEYATTQQRGTALDAFLTRLVADLASNRNFGGLLAKRMVLIAGKLSEGTIDHAVSRVANRFALVQVALGLAHEYGLLPFPVEQIEWAIGKMFRDWLNNRGGDGSIEVKQACDKISYLLTTQETGERFFTLPDNGGLKTRNPLGYRRLDATANTEEILVYPAVFREELCKGCDPVEVAKELIRRGWLIPDAEGKSTRKQKINGKTPRFYCFRKWSTEDVPFFPDPCLLGGTGGTGGIYLQKPLSAVPLSSFSSGTGGTNNDRVPPVPPSNEPSGTAKPVTPYQVPLVPPVPPKRNESLELDTNSQIIDVEGDI
jgi:uncharacterized protein (DUF927 family)